MNDFCLNNNILIPNIGFGTWHIKDCTILEKSIVSAIRLGYRHIDTASKYENEEFIGKNVNMIKKYANILYKQKINNYNVIYIKNVVDFKLLEEKCIQYKK